MASDPTTRPTRSRPGQSGLRVILEGFNVLSLNGSEIETLMLVPLTLKHDTHLLLRDDAAAIESLPALGTQTQAQAAPMQRARRKMQRQQGRGAGGV